MKRKSIINRDKLIMKSYDADSSDLITIDNNKVDDNIYDAMARFLAFMYKSEAVKGGCI